MNKALVDTNGQQMVPAQEPSVLQIIADAATNPAVDTDKMKALLDMQERILDRRAFEDFNNAMNRVQAKMARIQADADNPSTKSKYASYAQLDRALKPLYGPEGFSISYDTVDSPKPEHERVVAYVSLGAYMRRYQVDMDSTGKGAKGGDVMTKIHAAGSAMTYGKRYLLGLIFNVSIGKDDDGNAAGDTLPRLTEEHAADLQAKLDELPKARHAAFLKYKKVKSVSEIADQAYGDCIADIERALKRGK